MSLNFLMDKITTILNTKPNQEQYVIDFTLNYKIWEKKQ